jgi:hypothetical protein
VFVEISESHCLSSLLRITSSSGSHFVALYNCCPHKSPTHSLSLSLSLSHSLKESCYTFKVPGRSTCCLSSSHQPLQHLSAVRRGDIANIFFRCLELYCVRKNLRCPRLRSNRLCGLVVRVPGYRSRGSGSIPGATKFPEN